VAHRNPATRIDKLLTAVLLLTAVFSYRTVLLGEEPGSSQKAEQLQQAHIAVFALQAQTDK